MEPFKCLICKEAEFDSKQKLSVHQIRCKEKHPDRINRAKRVPFGVPVKRFNAPDDPNYVYRVFNDNWRKEPGRLQRAVMAGYEPVEHERSGEAVGTNEDGSEIKGVLMRIPKELYDEDQELKQQEIDKVDAQIMGGTFKEVPKQYSPDGGIKKTIYR